MRKRPLRADVVGAARRARREVGRSLNELFGLLADAGRVPDWFLLDSQLEALKKTLAEIARKRHTNELRELVKSCPKER